MSYATDHPVHCAEQPEGCQASFPGSKWHAIAAGREGWFFPKEGPPHCPAHVPEWVARWRASVKEEGWRPCP